MMLWSSKERHSILSHESHWKFSLQVTHLHGREVSTNNQQTHRITGTHRAESDCQDTAVLSLVPGNMGSSAFTFHWEILITKILSGELWGDSCSCTKRKRAIAFPVFLDRRLDGQRTVFLQTNAGGMLMFHSHKFINILDTCKHGNKNQGKMRHGGISL